MKVETIVQLYPLASCDGNSRHSIIVILQLIDKDIFQSSLVLVSFLFILKCKVYYHHWLFVRYRPHQKTN